MTKETPAMTTPTAADTEAARKLVEHITEFPYRHLMNEHTDMIATAIAAARVEGEREATRLRTAFNRLIVDASLRGYVTARELIDASALAAQPASKGGTDA